MLEAMGFSSWCEFGVWAVNYLIWVNMPLGF